MENIVDFGLGTEFDSFDDFQARLTLFERQEYMNFCVLSSKLLKTNQNGVTTEIKEKIRYHSVRYTCKFGGIPRALVDENVRKRDTSTYRQKCSAYFVVVWKRGIDKLKITSFCKTHNHKRSKNVFAMLPKQRHAAIIEASSYLKHVVNIKPNIQMLQNEVCNSSKNAVKRQDIYNFKNKHQPTIVGENDLEKMANEMRSVEEATVKVIHNDKNELEAIYFQDLRMKEYFANFPDLLMFDGTYKLNDARMPLIILVVVNGNGETQIVGLFLVKSENCAIFNFLFTHFKAANPNCAQTEVIITDKHFANCNVIQQQFPNAAHHLCVFHVAQIFQREITTKKRNITTEQRKECLEIVNKMIYAQSVQRYDELYQELVAINAEGVNNYFDNNWHTITEQWVRCHIKQFHTLANRTNNRLESLNQKLKAVITKYTALPTFAAQLMVCVSSLRIEKDIRAIEKIHKKPVNKAGWADHDEKYANLLTNYAFKKYMKETGGFENVVFVHIDNVMSVYGDLASQRILTREINCDCEFFRTMSLPCKHIIAFRAHNGLDLFDEAICLNRWRKDKITAIGQLEYVLDDEPNVEIVEMPSTQAEPLKRARTTHNQKYRKTKSLCDDICTFMAELPEVQFQNEYKSLLTLHAQLKRRCNEGRYILNACLLLRL